MSEPEPENLELIYDEMLDLEVRLSILIIIN